jgi:hypothetical protein
MPPMPPPGAMAGPGVGFFGSSATMASVVIRSAATEAAFWIATRTTLVGSMMPLEIRLAYSPVCGQTRRYRMSIAVRAKLFVGIFPRQPYLRVTTGVHHTCSMPLMAK